MGWSQPSVRATSDLITASIWNGDLTDNLAYLKAQTDTLDDCTQTRYLPAGARSFATDYTNSTKIRIISVSAFNSVTADAKMVSLVGYVKTTSPIDTQVCNAIVSSGLVVNPMAAITFVVPPSWLYKVIASATDVATLAVWAEWDLH